MLFTWLRSHLDQIPFKHDLKLRNLHDWEDNQIVIIFKSFNFLGYVVASMMNVSMMFLHILT